MDKIELFEEYRMDMNSFESLVESNMDKSISTLFPYIFKKADNLLDIYGIRADSEQIRELANFVFKGITQEFMGSYKDLTYRYFKAIDGIENFDEEKQITTSYIQQLQELLNKELKRIMDMKFGQFENELSIQCNRQSHPNINVFKNHLLNGIQDELGNIHGEIKNYIYNRAMDKCRDYINTKESIIKQDQNKVDYNEISEFIELVQNEYLPRVSQESPFSQEFNEYCRQAELLTSNTLNTEQVDLLMRDINIRKKKLLEQMKFIETGQEYTENFEGYETLDSQEEKEDLGKLFK